MGSFDKMATVTASTRRDGVVIVASLRCLPLSPVSAKEGQGIEGLSFREMLQTSIGDGLDVAEGDQLIVGGIVYPIRSVARWPWPPTNGEYLTLLLENRRGAKIKETQCKSES